MPRPSSIKRAVFYGATVGLVMLLALAGASTYSLMRYRDAINDFDYAVNKMPRKAELAYQFGRLFEPLKYEAASSEAQKLQKERFLSVLTDVERRFDEFRSKLMALPESRQKPGITSNLLLSRLRSDLELMRSEGMVLGSPQHEGARRHLIHILRGRGVKDPSLPYLQVGVFERIEKLPPLSDTVKVPLKASQRHYQRLSTIVVGITLSAIALFLLLVYFGLRGISGPIQEVVRGARRVAQREFDYRIDVSWPEEMAELSGALNLMTGRFRETEQEYERQVEERSRQLVRSERLADVGFIAAGVSHEINNPLHAIMGAAESLQQRLPELTEGAPESEVSAVREYLKMIERQSERCSRITTMLKDFARKSDDVRAATNLVAIVDEVLQLVGHLSKYRNREITFARSQAAVVDINASQIQQVVLNLVANALESMEAGGRLEIRIIDQVDFVVLEFEDDGCGMTPEVQRNLFEPFFTQRRDGGGTGLGLSITDRIVKEHDGIIEASSDGPGHGSLFRVRLPRRAVQSEAA